MLTRSNVKRDNVHLSIWHIAAIGLRFRWVKGEFIFAPDDHQLGLFIAHPCLPLGIGINIGTVVVKQIALNFSLAGLIEKVVSFEKVSREILAHGWHKICLWCRSVL